MVAVLIFTKANVFDALMLVMLVMVVMMMTVLVMVVMMMVNTK